MNDGRQAANRDGWLPADHASGGDALQGRVARGLTWTLLDSWGTQLLGLVVFVILARLLTEADFGLVALATVFMFLAQMIVDQGLGDAIIQRPTLTRRQVDTAFWTAVATGVVLTAAGLILATPIATLLGEPDLGPILQVLSITFVLAALSSIQIALMRRDLAFRELALRRLVAVLGAGIIGIGLAFAGAGAWALVAQHVTNAVLSVAVLWAVSPWRPGLQASLADFRELFAFGSRVLGSEVLGFLSRNVDNLLIGVFLGTAPLGLYAVAYKVLDTTQQLLVNAAQKLAFPVFSRLQTEHDRLRRAYVRVTRAVSLVTLPGYVGLSLVAHEAFVVVFGPRWAPSAEPAALLFLVGPVVVVQLFSGALLNAVGHPEITFRIRLATTIVNVAGFAIAVALFRDITAVAAAFVIRGYLLLPLILYWLRRYAGIPWSAHLAELRTPVVATALMAVAILGVKLALAGAVGPAVLLAAEVAVGAVVYTGAAFIIERALLTEVATFFVEALPGGDRLGRTLGLSMADRLTPLRTISAADEMRNVDVGADGPRSVDA